MARLAWIAVFGLFLAGCAADRTDSAAGGATTAASGNEDMRGSQDTAPGAEGDRQRPRDAMPARRY